MAGLKKDILHIIMQFLREEKYNETLHKMEVETKLFFDVKYFEELILEGNWDEADKYFLSFTKLDEHPASMKIVFEIRKHKYLEALDRNDIAKATDLLMHELKVFGRYNVDLFSELTGLLTKDNFREHAQLNTYTTSTDARVVLVADFRVLLMSHPVIREKMRPLIEGGRLKTMVNQSLNWQHQLCKSPQHDPDMNTLFEDHHCPSSSSKHRDTTGAMGQNQ